MTCCSPVPAHLFVVGWGPKTSDPGIAGRRPGVWPRTQEVPDMPDRTCSVEGCSKPCRSSRIEICNAHYFRLYRTGNLGTEPIRDRRPGASCSIDGCDAPVAARGWCVKHSTRYYRHGDPSAVKKPPVRMGEENPCWKGDEVGYYALHERLRRHRGPASCRPCALACGRTAAQWSYDRTDPNERQSPDGPYSTDLGHYRALCVPCHKRFDLDHNGGTT